MATADTGELRAANKREWATKRALSSTTPGFFVVSGVAVADCSIAATVVLVASIIRRCLFRRGTVVPSSVSCAWNTGSEEL